MSVRVTPAEAKRLLAGDRKNKYGIRLTPEGKAARTYNGILYDSAAESRYAAALDMRVKVGELKQWWRQVKHDLIVNGVKVGRMTIDFQLLHADDSLELCEVKGIATEAYKLRLKVFRALYPKSKLTVIKAKEIK